MPLSTKQTDFIWSHFKIIVDIENPKSGCVLRLLWVVNGQLHLGVLSPFKMRYLGVPLIPILGGYQDPNFPILGFCVSLWVLALNSPKFECS